MFVIEVLAYCTRFNHLNVHGCFEDHFLVKGSRG